MRVFEDDTFILYEFLLRGEMFNLAINPALRLYNVCAQHGHLSIYYDILYFHWDNIFSLTKMKLELKR